MFSFKILDLFNAYSPIKPRIYCVIAGLVAVNIALWLVTLFTLHSSAFLMSNAVLAYVLGLRHAVDPDHIAAIDNVTRKLMQEGQRPVSVGLWFALGHSTLVIAGAAGIAWTASSLETGPLAEYRDIGAIVSTLVSAGFLVLIAGFNLLVLRDTWRAYAHVHHFGQAVDAKLHDHFNDNGFLTRLFRPLFKLTSQSWHMFPLGLLFALGFDTVTEVSLFGLSAMEASKGLPIWSVLIYPALFTAGMTLMDTTDGILMLGAYGWAFIHPARKLVYNLTITSVSVFVALFIGSIEALGLIADKLKLEGWFWDAVGNINNQYFSVLGFGIVGLFVLAWGVSLVIFKRGYFDRIVIKQPS